jgi:hypothetical protein
MCTARPSPALARAAWPRWMHSASSNKSKHSARQKPLAVAVIGHLGGFFHGDAIIHGFAEFEVRSARRTGTLSAWGYRHPFWRGEVADRPCCKRRAPESAAVQLSECPHGTRM